MTNQGARAAGDRWGGREQQLLAMPGELTGAEALEATARLLGHAIGHHGDTGEVTRALEVLGTRDLAVAERTAVLRGRLAASIRSLITKREEAAMPGFRPCGQEVTCRGCGRTYTWTAEDDYFGPAGSPPENAASGRCFSCVLSDDGMDPEMTPATVIDPTGTRSTDPRDLARDLGDGAA